MAQNYHIVKKQIYNIGGIVMDNNKTEIWRAYPEIGIIEVSTLGRVRTLDRIVSSKGNGTQLAKGQALKQYLNPNGYMRVSIRFDGKQTKKFVHRLVAQTFLPNPDGFPMVNHKDCDPTNNNVSNLEWCTASYNSQYRENFGKSLGSPVFAISLSTLEVLHFRSQHEASRTLEINQGNINSVIKGKLKQTNGFWFVNDDGNGIEIDNDKLNDIAYSIPFTGGIFAVNLNTSEVSRFESQSEAGRVLGINAASINMVIKDKRNHAGDFWFVKDDGHAVDVVKSKLHDIGGTGLKIYS